MLYRQSSMNYIESLRQKIGNELLQIPGVGGLIRDSQNSLLFVRKSEDGEWGLPAGAIEPGETPKEAIVREVLEETGLKIRPLKIAGVFGGPAFRHTYPNGDKVEYLVVLLDCEIIEHRTPVGNEISEMKFFAENEMPSIALPYPVAVLYGHTPGCVGN